MGLSVKFNGYELNQYIDVLIGFTPFSGAEWSPELLGDAGLKRGADFSYTTYKQKQIPMPYTVLEDLGEKHDELARILNVDEPKELVFGNAPDRVFYAVPMGDLDFDDYECLGEGVITWLVPDGLAHSTVEKTFPASLNADGILEATIVNRGTESVPVSYEIVHKHENGYLGIVSQYGVMQYGCVEETDWENYKQNEKLVRLSDLSALPDDPGTNYMHPNHVMGGSLVTETIGGKPCLRLRSTGAVSAGKWIGAMKTLTVPADSEGHAGAKNFYCYLNHWFETGLMGQTAEQSIAFLTGDNKVICGYSLFKSDMTGNTACLEFWLNGKIVRSISFAPSSSDNANPFNNGRGHNDIRKEGDKVTFYWFGNYPSYRSSAIRNMECKKIQVAFTQFDSRGLGNKYVTRNYLRSLEFQKMGVEKWRDVPNRYQEGDVVSIDGEAARVYVNGMANTGDEMIGTKYFHVPPGETKVQFYYSSFCNPAPVVTARIKEAFL
ncbi:distal tail protein Dit [Sporofaciens sp. JLR.KK001]|uniref:distal tail protein Dit n=1 Tax=Sporofaciens sp. JLR.KK001 TaxID=3112621 RepID=UPI002FEEB3F9